ncbi:VOC family protein [Goodfellowiella coeruleoviolacea]|uniref:Glyoxalase-like domain-containing protein n=1 Tax=Goodfellowiella coeruleoviolacea TaxID=334858 RepID=A0AAE3KMA0_9PSEU|nr:VOC family protein [Goodfellowiella coeruleoviolacea]MCP2167348.1 Glyoxalase-like domain-containing protein [Goodfellowiella coeruleoviolacea]
MSGTGDLEPRLDHLVYAVTDLEAAVAEFAERTGVSPVEGGRHLGRGTRNHLVGLGPTSYLEIIGPDRDNPPEPATAVPFGLDRLTAPKLVTWAVRPADIEAAVVAARQAGADHGPVQPMSRRTPDGALLEWRLASTHPAPLAGITPFLIDWGDTPHPASTGLPRVELAALHATHPDPAAVRRVSDALGITLDVTAGPVGLRAVLVTPRGTVTLD